MKSARWLGLFTLAAAACASTHSVEDYEYFRSYGIFDPDVPDETASALVREGIASEDPEIRDLTIEALGAYVMHVVHEMPSYDYGPTPERSFSVPDLKSFLIGYWREHRSGYSTAAAASQGVFGVQARLDDASPEEVVEGILISPIGHGPLWAAIPEILCVLYPGDDEVLELVWKRENTDASIPKPPIGTLYLLNLGHFATPEANAFRIDALVAPGRIRADAAVILAAEGLALSRPVEAVPHLVSAVLEYPQASGDVLVALAGYGDDVLSHHAVEIAAMVEELHVKRPPMGAVADAVLRLGAFGRRQRAD